MKRPWYAYAMNERIVKAEVKAGARNESVKVQGGVWTISVKEPAAGNRANTRARQLIARECGAAFSKVTLVKGHASPRKTFKISSSK